MTGGSMRRRVRRVGSARFAARWLAAVFLCLALFCVPVPGAAGAVVCRSDSECKRREECRPVQAKGISVRVKTCQCYHYTFAWGAEPQCIVYSWRTNLVSFLALLMALGFASAIVQYMVAYREHMTDPPLRAGESCLARLLSLRTLFLAFATLAALSAVLFAFGITASLYTPIGTDFWWHSPLSPIQLGASLHSFGAASAFLVIVCTLVRVAAKLHDPASSTKKALYQLAFALDGSGLGLYLAVFLALPSCGVVIYFNLKGDWSHAFVSAAIFIVFGLILTTLTAKLLAARRAYYRNNTTRRATSQPSRPLMRSLWSCLSRHSSPVVVARSGADSNSKSSSSGESKASGAGEEEGAAALEEGRRARVAVLRGDVAASVSAECLLYRFSVSTSLAQFHDSPPRARMGEMDVYRTNEPATHPVGGTSPPTHDSQHMHEGDVGRGEEAEGRQDERGGSAKPGSGSSGGKQEEEDLDGTAQAHAQDRGPYGPVSISEDSEIRRGCERNEMEARLRGIRADAGKLGKHVIATAACGMAVLLFGLPLGPWRYLYLGQMMCIFTGGLILHLANFNCLCYISPAVRRNVSRWTVSANPLLVCIAMVLWKPQH